VEAIHDLAADDAVAAVVTTDFLRRPAIASKAMADDTARHAVNEAQFDRFRQQAQFVHQEAAPQLQRMEHSAQFMDLVAHRVGTAPTPDPLELPPLLIGQPAHTDRLSHHTPSSRVRPHRTSNR
jgi:hypothetical protein